MDQQLYANILKRIMREQGVSLLVAHLQLIDVLGDAVDQVREEYLKENDLTIEELLAK
jgi:hypothetical protein